MCENEAEATITEVYCSLLFRKIIQTLARNSNFFESTSQIQTSLERTQVFSHWDISEMPGILHS